MGFRFADFKRESN